MADSDLSVVAEGPGSCCCSMSDTTVVQSAALGKVGGPDEELPLPLGGAWFQKSA